MLVAYFAIMALNGRNWVFSVALFSLAVSVKMNVLLFAPGVLAVIIKVLRIWLLFSHWFGIGSSHIQTQMKHTY